MSDLCRATVGPPKNDSAVWPASRMRNNSSAGRILEVGLIIAFSSESGPVTRLALILSTTGRALLNRL